MPPPPKKIRKYLSAKALQADKAYKSPQRKLVHFFEKSRNQWKAKCLDAKATVKGLNNRIRFLERSKEHWKSKVKELEKAVEQLKAEERTREQEIEALKKSILNKREI